MTSQLGVELLQPHSVCQIVLIFRDQECRRHDDSYAPTHHPLNFEKLKFRQRMTIDTYLKSRFSQQLHREAWRAAFDALERGEACKSP